MPRAFSPSFPIDQVMASVLKRRLGRFREIPQDPIGKAGAPLKLDLVGPHWRGGSPFLFCPYFYSPAPELSVK